MINTNKNFIHPDHELATEEKYIRSCLVGLRLRLHNRLQLEPCQTVLKPDSSSSSGAEAPGIPVTGAGRRGRSHEMVAPSGFGGSSISPPTFALPLPARVASPRGLFARSSAAEVRRATMGAKNGGVAARARGGGRSSRRRHGRAGLWEEGAELPAPPWPSGRRGTELAPPQPSGSRGQSCRCRRGQAEGRRRSCRRRHG